MPDSIMPDMEWSEATSFERAAKNVRSDIFGDWYRDPWGWPETEWTVREAVTILVDRLNDSGTKRTLPVQVPKENFVIRPAVLLDPIDRLAYKALVDSLSAELIGELTRVRRLLSENHKVDPGISFATTASFYRGPGCSGGSDLRKGILDHRLGR